MTWKSSLSRLRAHARLLSYGVASCFIIIWTLLRFYTSRTIFDLVGQQVLASQWLHGATAGSTLGATNYVPKIFVLYMPLHALPGSPRLKLIVLTVLVNLATLILLGLITERLLRLYRLRVGGALWAGLIWLSTIAGSVFWMQFTNSRNLEVAGGMLLLYLGLRYVERPSREVAAIIAAYCCVLFFADTLQIYMIGLPLLIIGAYRFGRARWRAWGLLLVAVLGGVVGSKLIVWGLEKLLHIRFLTADSYRLSSTTVTKGVVGSIKAFIHLYAGGSAGGRAREVINLAVLATWLTALIYALRRGLVRRRLAGIVLCIVVVDTLMYIFSGQAQRGGTERYLIMTAPALLLLWASLEEVWRRFWYIGWGIVVVSILLNGLQLGQATVSADHRFTQDAHLQSVQRYALTHPHTRLYASMDTAIPVAYLYGGVTDPLPLTCDPSGKLTKDSLFFSRSSYAQREHLVAADIGIVLDGTAITNTPAICTLGAITAQLGAPRVIDRGDDGSLVLRYPSQVANRLQY